MTFKYNETQEYVKAIAAYCKETYGQVKDTWKTLIKLIGDEYDTYLQAQESIAATGLLVDNGRGLVANPAVKIKVDALVQIQKLCNELGITPKQEIKLKTQEAKDDSDDFLDSLTK